VTDKEFRGALGFTAEELPEAEFDEYWRITKQHRLVENDLVETWWRDRSATFPKLHQVAVYVLRTPCVVTSCDTAISVLGSMFSSQQNRIDTSVAAQLVAMRCNGDVAEDLLPARGYRTSFC
jgi:hypothetical protein